MIKKKYMILVYQVYNKFFLLVFYIYIEIFNTNSSSIVLVFDILKKTKYKVNNKVRQKTLIFCLDWFEFMMFIQK